MNEKEFQEKLHSRSWRLNHLYSVLTESGEKVPFRLNPSQQRFYDEMWYFNIILKARQMGFTTFIQLLMLDACLFNKDTHAGVIAHNKDDASAFFANKIKFAYDNLPHEIRDIIQTESCSKTEMRFNNGSSIRVGTSMRSGTLKYLHVSEFGKICNKYPDRAREVVTGAFNAVHQGSFIYVESTAEGQGGYFHDMVQEAQAAKRRGDTLTKQDFKFHFFPWWQDKRYVTPAETVPILDASLDDYFNRLRTEHDIVLSADQKAWYARKRVTQEDDIKREFPSYPDEAFEQSVIGAYYSTQLNQAEKDGRICDLPIDESVPVDTWWDLGAGEKDATAIWFTQFTGEYVHVIDYYELFWEGLPQVVADLQRKPYVYGQHYAPWDIKQNEWGSGKTKLELAQDYGIYFERIPLAPVQDGINAAKVLFPRCKFDRKRCDVGLKRLRNYRRKWNDADGRFMDKPHKDGNDHGADAYRYLAMGFDDMMYRDGLQFAQGVDGLQDIAQAGIRGIDGARERNLQTMAE